MNRNAINLPRFCLNFPVIGTVKNTEIDILLHYKSYEHILAKNEVTMTRIYSLADKNA